MERVLKILDCEVYPEWWCVCVSELNYKDDEPCVLSEKEFLENVKVYRSDRLGDDAKLFDHIRTGTLCGWNIKCYDLKILRGIMTMTPQGVYQLSKDIISGKKSSPDTYIGTYYKSTIRDSVSKSHVPFYENCQDLMDDLQRQSLKNVENCLGMSIVETDVPFDQATLSIDEKARIIEYCKHDVYAVHVFYTQIRKPYVDAKETIMRMFNIPAKSGYIKTNAGLCAAALGATSVLDYEDVNDERLITGMPDELYNFIKERIPAKIFDHITTSRKTLKCEYLNNVFKFGDGGLHSCVNPGKNVCAFASDEYAIYDIDAASCYATAMLVCGTISRAVPLSGKQTLERIYNARIDLKAKKKRGERLTSEEKAMVTAGKLILNTSYGAMGNNYIPLYDPYMRSATGRISQLVILGLTALLNEKIPNMILIQSNTDGIYVFCKRAYKPILDECVEEYSKLSHFVFDIEEVNAIWQKNVSNIMVLEKDGSVKKKGKAFITNVEQEGYNRVRPYLAMVCAKACEQWLVHRVDPVKFLLKHKDVFDFCITLRRGSSYTSGHQMAGGTCLNVQKENRGIAVLSSEYGQIFKVKENREDSDDGDDSIQLIANSPTHTYLVNGDIRQYNFDDIKRTHGIDYLYYANIIRKVLDGNGIEPTYWTKIVDDRKYHEITDEYNMPMSLN